MAKMPKKKRQKCRGFWNLIGICAEDSFPILLCLCSLAKDTQGWSSSNPKCFVSMLFGICVG